MVDIFRRHQWFGFFELLRGYDDDVAWEFPMSLTPRASVSVIYVVRVLLVIVGCMGPTPSSALVSQTNPYTTGPFGISPWSAD